MAKFTLTINTDNAAFEDDVGGEVATILRNLASHIAKWELNPGDHGRPVDTNGNVVGQWSYVEKE